ncbi:MAG: hypothetical protein KGR25_11480, partial [Chloroflexi bacterium]|nr:hypothetical protein [Chloroflexota bacterium]
DMGRAGKDARGPGWNPVLQNPAGALAGPSSRIGECVGPIRSTETDARELSPCRSPKTPAGEGAGAPRGGSPRITAASALPFSVTGNVRTNLGRWPHHGFASPHTTESSPLPCFVTTTGGAQ